MRFARNLLFTAASGVALLANAGADAGSPVTITYVPNSLAEATITNGPWTLHQAVGRNPHDASGILPPPGTTTPYSPPTTVYGTPYKNYCVGGAVQTAQAVNPMQPFYFPFVRDGGGQLQGFFDYRPRNEEEATVEGFSTDGGMSWIFKDEALALNPYCPADPTDPDNNNVIVDGLSTPYGSNSANAADNGLGHAFVMTVGGVQRIYHLNRANGEIDSAQLVVHTLSPKGTHLLAGLPAYGYVSPLGSRGYPTLEATAQATSGLTDPDAILGAAQIGGVTTVLYVEKQLSASTANNCVSTPSWALTNLDTGKAKKANKDIITIQIATTSDGINFVPVGVASGLQVPTTTAFNGIRWLGSGSLIALANGHYGLFFGAGNCLDNDSDGFHFIGYAETTNPVNAPSDLENWTVIYGFDNPILSTDTVTDGTLTYPANPPLITAAGADVLTPAQVSPWVPPADHNANFFSGRVYDPQAIPVDSSTVTVVFAGYNTPQPSSNLGDYRTIGRFQVQFPPGYVVPPAMH
jgi:hypothetical protein